MWKYKSWSPPQIIILTFCAFILFGTILLKLPLASTQSISWIDALFTATTAMKVTGLAVDDTAGSFTYFGEMVIAGLIQVGGLAMTMHGMTLIVTATFILTITENQPFLVILFEVISAFGTVGLSMGITGSLTITGKVIIIIIMFLGKVGPLTLAFAIAKTTRARIKYPSEDVMTG
ncbi:hypothetical protein F9U64_21200 [Gracilibacillus oryzae]|uniref:Ktr system potassium uptake protein B n=1 Tax=Gracilibacillus oryzae TaxID=1672701 RepID=A0A7C8GQJ6_9BACI|nr:potassium transporter TrkG [Gracilibacillus oryzae]KAB8125913.1 hypothetical protein F9U64_21200 [Gracilibacillus oryzae]